MRPPRLAMAAVAAACLAGGARAQHVRSTVPVAAAASAAALPGAQAFADKAAALAAWEGALAARLRDSAAYREAGIRLAKAEAEAAKAAAPALPSVGLGQSSIVFDDAGFKSASLAPRLGLEGLGGASLSLGLPLSLSRPATGGTGKTAAAGPFAFGPLSLSLSRRLFTESGVDRILAEAALRSSRAALADAEEQALLALAGEVLEAAYGAELLELNRRHQALLEVQASSLSPAASAAARRQAERLLLQARKASRQAESSLAAFAPDFASTALELREVLPLVLATRASGRADEALLAQELRLEAARRRAGFASLPLLPNPSLSLGLSWDPVEGSIGATAGLSLNYELHDGGARQAAARERAEGPAIEALKLKALRESRAAALRQAEERRESLGLDRRLAELELEDASEEAARLRALLAAGLESEEGAALGTIRLERARLGLRKADNDILLQDLRLALLRNLE